MMVRIVCFLPGERQGTSNNGPSGEVPPETGTFIRLEVYKRVGIPRAEVSFGYLKALSNDLEQIHLTAQTSKYFKALLFKKKKKKKL